MENLTIQEEANILKDLFKGINRAEFARTHKIKGGATFIYQHITARRPLNLEAALAYAKALKVHLKDISPRLMEELKNANKHLSHSQAPYYEEIERVIELMESTDDRGRLKCLLAVEDALSMHTAITAKSKVKQESSMVYVMEDRHNYIKQSEIEQAIIDNFRNASKEGKELIINATVGSSKEKKNQNKAS